MALNSVNMDNTSPTDAPLTLTGSEIKPIFIILVDISGYTRFIRLHKISLLHAEKIVSQLMESILDQVEFPVIAHEILGDAISLYAIDDGTGDRADKIYAQLHKYFLAFRQREAMLISECSICECDGCKQVGKLKLKAILHFGEAAFTSVYNTRKISGEDIIVSHRLLKNSLEAKEYILLTKAFTDRMIYMPPSDLVDHREEYDDIGPIDLMIKFFNENVIPANLTFRQKLKGLLAVEKYMVKRFFFKSRLTFKNLPQKQKEKIPGMFQ